MKCPTENIISGLLKKHPASFSIFFWGLCKNAGKTTALLYTYDALKTLTNRPIIVLSSGYDGEELDAITGLAKPQVEIQENDYCITANKFITGNDFHILFTGNENTVYGQPVIAQATRTTKITIATAGNNVAMQQILQNPSLPPDAIYLIDGAINRKAFFELAGKNDYISISTGNSFSNEIETIKNELLYQQELFGLPFNSEAKPDCSLLDASHAATLKNTSVVLKNKSHIFLSRKEYELFKHKGNRIVFAEQSPELLWITFNPFDALKNRIGEDYTNLLNEMIQSTPVLNLKKELVAS